MSDIFISYARSTAPEAQRIAEALRGLGYGVWRDDELPAHRSYADVIEERLSTAQAVVVLWSAEAVRSEWVRSEANRAREDKKLVQISLDGSRPPMPFDQIQCADLAGWTGESGAAGWRKVAHSVSALVRPGGYGGAAEPARKRRALSVCVLPFANMSGDAEQEYFSDGISEDIITDLSKVSALQVVSRNSAFQFKGRHVDVRQVARQLDVSHVLEGSVRKAANRVRITAQLIEGAADSHVWAERYDRDLTDIFAVQDEIAQAIVAALKLKLLPAEKNAITRRGTESAEAYDTYLMARQLWLGGPGPQGAETIIRLCQRAIEIDPEYAEAWSLMARTQSGLHHRYGRPETGLAAAERARSLDPGLAEPHAVMAHHLGVIGRREEANAAIELALSLNPDSYEAHATAGGMRFREGRYADAADHYAKACALMDQMASPAAMLMSCYAGLGDPAARRRAAQMTLERAEKALALDPNHGSALTNGANALAALGEAARAREWISRALLVEPDNRAMRYNLACTLSLDLNDVNAAIGLLTPYFHTATIGEVAHAEVDPDLEPLRGDGRFQALIADAKRRLAGAQSADAVTPGSSAPSD